MTAPIDRFGALYLDALTAFLGESNEASLGRAYELGRQAMLKGLGVLDMASLHQAAIGVLTVTASVPDQAQIGQAAAGLIRVVLENLLGNAWKFTAKRALGEIRFGRVPGNGPPIYFVRDNGAGFDMAAADKLFSPFQRLHSPAEFEGTGIGLATVQRVIERHGGQVWVESKLDRGTTFYFTLSHRNS